MALLPEDVAHYSLNQRIEAKVPSKTSVEVEGGKWVFKGFDKDHITANMENADNTGRVKFVGRWEFVAEEVPGIPTTPSTPTTPTTPTDPTTPAETNSGTGVTNPQTGDNSCLVLWITLFVASVFGIAGIAGIAVCSRRKRVR